jgi:hypothetical protein
MEEDMEDDSTQLSDSSELPESDSSSNNKQASKCAKEIPQNEIEAMRELALAATLQLKRPRTLSHTTKYHRKTGQIRTPRETSDSGTKRLFPDTAFFPTS